MRCQEFPREINHRFHQQEGSVPSPLGVLIHLGKSLLKFIKEPIGPLMKSGFF